MVYRQSIKLPPGLVSHIAGSGKVKRKGRKQKGGRSARSYILGFGKRKMQGAGFFSDLAKKIKGSLPAIKKFAQENKLVSRSLRHLGQDKLAKGAESLGYGKKKRLYNHMKGAGFFGDIWEGIKKIAGPVHDIVKSTGLVSKGLALVPGVGSSLSMGAKALGYGKPGRPRKSGRGLFSDLKNSVNKVIADGKLLKQYKAKEAAAKSGTGRKRKSGRGMIATGSKRNVPQYRY